MVSALIWSVCWFWRNPYHYSTVIPTSSFWQMVSTQSVVLEQVLLKGGKNFKPHPQTRILVPFRSSFQNFQRAPPFFFYGRPPPRGLGPPFEKNNFHPHPSQGCYSLTYSTMSLILCNLQNDVIVRKVSYQSNQWTGCDYFLLKTSWRHP